MDATTLLAFSERIETDLRRNILPFWMNRAVDPTTDSFHGEVTNDGRVVPGVERGALLTCRILWTFSAAFVQHGDLRYREMADRAYRDLLARFQDRTHGGFIWSIADGTPARPRKQVYGQAFAIYALSEYHRATDHTAALQQAVELFHRLERHARDARHGGYFEAFAQDWAPIADQRLSEVDLNEPKSQNTLLHVMEAYTNLLRVWPHDSLREALAALLEIMLTHVLDARTHHLGLFFSEDWRVRSDRISYGHDIEAAWLLTEAGDVLGDPALRQRIHAAAVRIAEVTLAEGVDTDGSVVNEGGPSGVTDTKREWWPQAEAIVGFLNAAQLNGGEPRFIQAALRTWEYVERHLIDREHGEWFRFATRDGAVSRQDPKISFWKCPYHNGRTGLEAPRRLRVLAATLTRSPSPS